MDCNGQSIALFGYLRRFSYSYEPFLTVFKVAFS